MTAGLEHLVVEGLGPIRRVELDLTTDITVLIGANGSGKSNLVSALELVARIWDDSFQDYLYRRVFVEGVEPFGSGRGEGVVHGGPGPLADGDVTLRLGLGCGFEQGRVNHPQETPGVFFDQPAALSLAPTAASSSSLISGPPFTQVG